MDKKTKLEKNNYHTTIPALTNHPTHLWLGNAEALRTNVEQQLQKVFCLQKGCSSCVQCLQINERQHSFTLWLSPEKSYTADQLEPIFKTTAFALQPNESFFFIIEKADYLNQTCANALLKLLEEPPIGYHFILLAQRAEYILPTIRSRCLVHTFPSKLDAELNQLVTWFTKHNLPDATTFMQTLDQAPLHERESLELIDEILLFWTQKLACAQQKTENEHCQKMLQIFSQALEQAPMPGSSKIFWKDLYLKVFFL